MKNLRIWIHTIAAISLVAAFSCTSAVNKQTKEETIETVEEFDEDSAYYAEDTTAVDDEGVLEDTTEEGEE